MTALDHPALETAIGASDADAIRRLFTYERDLRLKAETALDSMRQVTTVHATTLAREARGTAPSTSTRPSSSFPEHPERPKGGETKTARPAKQPTPKAKSAPAKKSLAIDIEL